MLPFIYRAESGDVQAPSRYVQDEVLNSSEEVSYSAINNVLKNEVIVNLQFDTKGSS